MDKIHTGLDVVGMIPAVGNVADLANAGLYAIEGDAVNAGISLAGCIPGAGQAATGARVATKLGKEVLEEAVEKGVKEVAEQTLKKGAKEAAEEVAEQGAKKAAKEAGEEVVEEGATAASKNIGTKVSESPPKKVTTPDAAAKKKVQGEYTDPLTNEKVKTPSRLEADHIFPKKEIEQLPGFDKLTHEQKAAVLNNADNFQGLPRSYNASKGSKTNWDTYKGQSLDPDYANELMKRQEQLKAQLQKQIDDFIK